MGEALKIAAYILKTKFVVSLFLRLHISYGHKRSVKPQIRGSR